MIPQIAEISTKFEEAVTTAHNAEALAAVREEHAGYFEALEAPDRLLVGVEVPNIGKEGTSVIKDEADAASWKNAAKHVLAGEVRSRASKAMDEQKPFLDTVQQAISLFTDNADLVPGTKDFDMELATRFTEMAEPYEVRVDGKLHGYSIGVQPLITKLRAQLATERAAAPSAAAPAAPAPATAPAAGAATQSPPAASTPPEQPQAGITSKAGAGAEGDGEAAALWGTLNLPPLRL